MRYIIIIPFIVLINFYTFFVILLYIISQFSIQVNAEKKEKRVRGYMPFLTLLKIPVKCFKDLIKREVLRGMQ